MAASALASRALQPPHGRHPAAPPPRARPAIAAAPRARARVARCRAVATDERPADPAFPEGQNGGLPGAVERPEADVVVIGSGLGGLCCAGLLARYGQDVLVLESHDRPGGAAHSFDIKGFNFDSGPSLFSGFQSRGPQANPLAQVLDALGESVPCASYDSWMVYVPEGQFLSRIGPTDFLKDLETFVGIDAVQEWKKLLDAVIPMSAAAMALPPLSIRGDLGILSTAAGRYAPSLLKSFIQMGPQGALGATKLLRPFQEIVDSLGLKNPFVRNWIDLLCFLLAGVKSDGALSAEMVYMFAEWYKPGCLLEYPLGGTGAIIDALVRGIEKFGGRLALRSHVERILIENGRAVGVKLQSGQVVRAKKAVVSNASMWDTLDLLPPDVVPKSYEDKVKATPQCDSFMHLHLGFDAENAREDLGIHHIVVDDWNKGVDGEQNVVLISVPSVLSKDLAPPGKHILHAYTPGTEPFSIWEGLDRKSADYRRLKEERSEVMWKAVELALGPKFSREKCDVKLVGTPLTHKRFLRRNRGTYGPAIKAGEATFPGQKDLPRAGGRTRTLLALRRIAAWARLHLAAMASDARLSLPCRLPSALPPPVLCRLPRAAAASTSPRCHCRVRVVAPAARPLPRARGGRCRPRAASEGEAQAAVQQQQGAEGEVVDSNVLPYCSINRKEKKTIGEMEQEFLQAMQAFYYDKEAVMSNEEFDNLKEELMWEGSKVVMLSQDEQIFLEACMAYVSGKPIMTDAEFDELKLRLKKEGSSIVQEGPRCSLRSRKVYSDLTVDYFKMFLLNVPAAVVALTLFFFLDDLTGFEITYLLELPEPFSFIFTWFAALPLIFWVAQSITSAIIKDFLILKGPCPNCGNENLSFFGTILSVPSGGAKNSVKCANCGSELVYDSASRLITLPELAEA